MNLLSFDLNLLRVLDALLREQSTVKAGQRLNLSQPAISAALSRLRAAMNDPLFVRQGQRIVPTEYARSLEIPLKRLLDDLAELLSAPLTFDPLTAERNFKIAGSDFFGEILMPSLAPLMHQFAPKIRIQLVDLLPGDHISTLEKHGIDLAIMPEDTFPHWVDSATAFHAGFVVIARSGHPALKLAGLKPGDTLPVDLFCDLGHIVFSPEGKIKAMGDAALMRMGRERRVMMTMPAFGGICNAVSVSDLIALLPEPLATKMSPRLGLDIYYAPMALDKAHLQMVWHKRNTGHAGHRWLRNLILETLTSLDANPFPVHTTMTNV